MSVGSIGSSSVSLATLQQQSNFASAQPVRREAENDGDKDDGSAAASVAKAPTVNLNGQVVGKTINVTA
ncbi:hypothetical protein [Propionivibrio dicarboxylicus]|uniref:hypothetical protein n=1 Tax=Propionivibrio dicarboxylicus TaxID=83767 RepID=UPI00115F96BE|nr:hypothetical protein [Propionivibrio dicarboxylicus]